VKFFIEHQERGDTEIDLNPGDRWGGTPLDDAYLHGNGTIIEMLKHAGSRRGATNLPRPGGLPPVSPAHQAESSKTAELIWAASAGDLATIYRLVAQGIPLDIGDYDLRTPLHLAASEGHLKVVNYFIAQDIPLNPRDRWGNTSLDDAIRHGRNEVIEALQSAHLLHGAQGDLPSMRRTRPLLSRVASMPRRASGSVRKRLARSPIAARLCSTK